MILTATHLFDMIQELPLNHPFAYVNPKSKSVVEILSTESPQLVVTIKRTTKDNTAKESRVGFEKLKILAEGLVENTPISIDDLLRNNDNVRSAIEAILVRTSEIYTYTVKNHKTLVWVPSKPHNPGQVIPLAPSDYHLVRQRTISPIDSKLLSAFSSLVEREIKETISLKKELEGMVNSFYTNTHIKEPERILRNLNDCSSKIDILLERQNKLFQLLTK